MSSIKKTQITTQDSTDSTNDSFVNFQETLDEKITKERINTLEYAKNIYNTKYNSNLLKEENIKNILNNWKEVLSFLIIDGTNKNNFKKIKEIFPQYHDVEINIAQDDLKKHILMISKEIERRIESDISHQITEYHMALLCMVEISSKIDFVLYNENYDFSTQKLFNKMLYDKDNFIKLITLMKKIPYFEAKNLFSKIDLTSLEKNRRLIALQGIVKASQKHKIDLYTPEEHQKFFLPEENREINERHNINSRRENRNISIRNRHVSGTRSRDRINSAILLSMPILLSPISLPVAAVAALIIWGPMIAGLAYVCITHLRRSS